MFHQLNYQVPIRRLKQIQLWVQSTHAHQQLQGPGLSLKDLNSHSLPIFIDQKKLYLLRIRGIFHLRALNGTVQFSAHIAHATDQGSHSQRELSFSFIPTRAGVSLMRPTLLQYGPFLHFSCPPLHPFFLIKNWVRISYFQIKLAFRALLLFIILLG